MFVRTKEVKGHKYHQLVESYREDGRVRQRVVAHLGESESLDEAIETISDELTNLRTRRQALLHEQEGILEELHQKLPGTMIYHGGRPPRLGQFLTSRRYQLIEHGREIGYFRYSSSYSRPLSTNYGRGIPYEGYYGFMGICGRYWKISKEAEKLEARAKRTGERLTKLVAARNMPTDATSHIE